jgi:hypothetical protein
MKILYSDCSRLVPWVNRILYKQIINWLVFGTLFDPKGEFFIMRKSGDPDETLGASIKGGMAGGDNVKSQNKYIVDYSVVPSHFPMTLTERVLFIGYAIGILSNSESMMASSVCCRLSPCYILILSYPIIYQKRIFLETKEGLTMKQKEFFEKLNKLPMDTFRIEDLDETVEELASAVGKVTYKYLVLLFSLLFTVCCENDLISAQLKAKLDFFISRTCIIWL